MLTIRPATPADVPQILAFIRALATYEREPDAVVATEADLLRDGFDANPRFYCLIAELPEACHMVPAGFALYFHNYSTFVGRRGLYLEDLFVKPAFRGRGIGKRLLVELARVAIDRGCGRFEWTVLDWNEPAIAFYESLGAQRMLAWQICRLTGASLRRYG